MADVAHLTDILHGFSTAMLASTDPSTNSLHARPMQILRVEATGVLWFATYLDSAKVYECKTKSSPVLCTMQRGETYVSLTGSVEVISDRAIAKQLWDESKLRVWFPNGPEDPNYALLKFKPTFGEYWDFSGAMRRLSLLLEEGRAFFTRTKAQPQKIGSHEKIQVCTPLNANPIA